MRFFQTKNIPKENQFFFWDDLSICDKIFDAYLRFKDSFFTFAVQFSKVCTQ